MSAAARKVQIYLMPNMAKDPCFANGAEEANDFHGPPSEFGGVAGIVLTTVKTTLSCGTCLARKMERLANSPLSGYFSYKKCLDVVMSQKKGSFLYMKYLISLAVVSVN